MSMAEVLMATTHKESRTSASEPALCSKCKKLVQKSGNSIHSILAYSRCRCHRLLKYRMKHTSEVPPLPLAAGQSSTILVSCSKHKLPASQLVQVAQSLVSHSKQQLVVSSKDCRVPLPTIAHSTTSKTNIVVTENVSGDRAHRETKRETSLPLIPAGTTSVTKLPTISSQVSKTFKLHHQHTSPGIGRRGSSHVISEVMKCVPTNRRRELKQLFKLLDKDGDGHLTMPEFLSALPKGTTRCVGALESLKKLYSMLSESTYFGYREFIVCYSITEELKSIPTVEGWSSERLLSLARR